MKNPFIKEEENQSRQGSNDEISVREMIKTCMHTAAPMIISWGELLKGYFPNEDPYKLGLGVASIIVSAATGQSKYSFDEIKDVSLMINQKFKEG